MEINYIDVIAGGLIIVLGLKGLMGGMIKEVFGLAAIVISIYVASTFSQEFGTFLNEMLLGFEKPQAANLVGFVLLLVLLWVGILLLGKLVSKLVSLSGMGAIDKIFGFVFAAGKIFIVFSIIAYALSSVDFLEKKLENTTKDSMLFPVLTASGNAIINVDPALLQNTKQNATKQLDSLNVKQLSPKQLEEKIKARMSESNESLQKLGKEEQ